MATKRSVTDSLRNGELGKPRFAKAYGFAIVTGILFLVAWVGQFVSQIFVVMNESAQHGQPFQWAELFPQFFASTFENWQSEFLQLVWQAIGLGLLFLWGSSQSRESDERIEAKLDLLLQESGHDPAEVSQKINAAL